MGKGRQAVPIKPALMGTLRFSRPTLIMLGA